MASENEDVGDEVVEITGTKKDIWPASVESHFICLMEEEVKKGNRQTTTLTKSAWRHIKEGLKSKFGKEYTLEQFKNKFNQLRGRWKDFTNLLKMETGLGYNSTTGQIIATDDQWKKLCEKYKSARQFKKKGCLHYDKLCIIYGDTTASGANQHPSTKSPSISNDDDSEGDNDLDQEEDSHQSKKKAKVSKDAKKRKARENAQEAFANALTVFGETAKRKVEIMEKMSMSNVAMTSNNATGEVVGQSNMQDKESLLTCLGILQGLEGIDGASFAKAVKLLKEDLLWRDVFLSLSDERKKDLVLKSMLPYALKRQKYIPLACCVIHNFIKMDMQDDPLFTQYIDENVELQVEELNRNNITQEYVPPQVTSADIRQMAAFRDRLAQRLWNARN